MKTKRLSALLLALVICIGMLFALTACNEDQGEPELPKLAGVTFKSATFSYDGTPKKIEVKDAPAGATITYEPTNTYTDVGTYSIKATVTLEGYQTLELTAKLIIIDTSVTDEANVTFDIGKASLISGQTAATVSKGGTVSAPNVVNNGYSLLGWYNGSEPWDFSTPVTDDITLTAKWQPVEYSVTYVIDDSYTYTLELPRNPENDDEYLTPTSFTVESGDLPVYNAVNKPGTGGVVFEYWYVKSAGIETKVDKISAGTTMNITLYAKTKVLDYTVTYNANGGTANELNVTNYNSLSEKIPLLPATLDYYDFVGWFDADDNYYPYVGNHVYGNLELIAKYTPIMYEIEYNLDGGENNAENPAEYGIESEFELLPATKENYKFVGWTDADGNPVTSIEPGSTGSKTLIATYTPLYTITYDTNTNGGTNNPNNRTDYTVEDEFELLPATKDYYDFVAWVDADGNPVTSIALGTSGNITLIATYTPTKYTITYELDGGTNSTDNPKTYTIEDEFNFSAPAKFGQKFAGWEIAKGDGTFEAITGITLGTAGEITVYARWEEFSCTISYNTMGGTLAPNAPMGYDPAEGATLLPATKTGYTFVGWFTSLTDDNSLVTEIPAGSEQSFVLYAKYVRGSEGIELQDNGDGTYTVIGYTGTETEVIIPTAMNGKAVVAIAENAFKDCTGITSIVIPDEITSIAVNAFVGCTNLEVINCEAIAKPDGFAEGFNARGENDLITVVYGYMDEENNVTPPQPFN